MREFLFQARNLAALKLAVYRSFKVAFGFVQTKSCQVKRWKAVASRAESQAKETKLESRMSSNEGHYAVFRRAATAYNLNTAGLGHIGQANKPGEKGVHTKINTACLVLGVRWEHGPGAQPRWPFFCQPL